MGIGVVQNRRSPATMSEKKDETDDESPPDPEQPLNPSPLPSVEDTLRAIYQANRTAFEKEIDQAGGALMWFRSVPRILEIVQSHTQRSLNDSAYRYLLLLETKAFWTGIETRLGECARCPPEGGACDGPARDRLNEGIFVRLEVLPSGPREHPEECERYQEFRMSRRLEKHGVVRALSRTKLLGIASDHKEEVLLAFNACLESGVGKPAPVNTTLLIEGAQARAYGVALLRSILHTHGSCEFESAVVDALIREWRDAYTVKNANPIRALAEVQVLVLDGIDSNFLHSEKLGLKELQWLYRTRRDQGLCTIITSLCPAEKAFPGITVLRV